MVFWSAAARFRWKWQPFEYMECSFYFSHCQSSPSYSCCQSSGLVATSAWVVSFRRRNSRSHNPVLELSDRRINQMFGCWIPSLQLDVRQNRQWTGEHSWLFPQRNKHLENAKNVKDRDSDRPHLPRALLSDEPRRHNNRDRSRRRNPAFLEHLPKKGERGEIEISPKHRLDLPEMI